MDRNAQPAVNYRISLDALEASARPEPEDMVATHPVPEVMREEPVRTETIQRMQLIAMGYVG
jgi:hypothetical protein